jgi:hypothetical protein
MPSKFGWSYPAGCSSTPYDVDLPPNPSGNSRDRRRAIRASFVRCSIHGCLAHHGECRKCMVEESKRLRAEDQSRW